MSVADLRKPIVSDNGRWMQGGPARYGFAVLAVAIATALQFGLRLLGPSQMPFLLFFPTVVLVAMLAGFWPGIVATVLAATSGGYFFLVPTNSFEVRTPEDLVGPALFAIIGVLLTVLTCGRNRAGQALRASEADLNRAQAVAHLGSWHYDLLRETLALSDEACRIMRLPPKTTVSPLQAQEMLHPDDRERTYRAWMAGLGRGTYDEESRVLVEGRTRWVRVQASVEYDKEGQPLAAVGTVQDITERKLAEERLQEFERVVQGLEEMIVVVDRDYRYILANRAFLEYRGMTKEQVLGHRAEEVLLPGVFEGTVREKLDECFRGKVVQYDLRYKYPSLGERDLCVSYFPIEGPGGIDRVAAVMQDITERKQARTLLEQKELLFRTLVESAPMTMVVSMGEAQRTEFHNPKFTELFGYTQEEVPDVDHWWPLAYPDEEYRRQISELWNKEVREAIARKGETPPIAARVRCKDGAERDVEFKLVCAGEKNLVFGTDLTEHKRLDKSLKLFRTLIDQS